LKNFILLTFLFSMSAEALEIFADFTPKKEIIIKAVKAFPSSSHGSWIGGKSFELTGDNGITQIVVCNEKVYNDFENKLKSYLIYTNIANIEIRHFEIDDSRSCEFLFEYVKGVFEFISFKKPIYVKLNIVKGVVEAFSLPNLDPYLDRLPSDSIQREKVRSNLTAID